VPADQSRRKGDPPSRLRGRRKPAGPARADAEDVLRVQDSREIRALAHPARMAIIDALASGDQLTATECAALTGLSPSATAYHLKFLERYGFAEPAAARSDGRERPWRATSRRPHVEFDPATPAGAVATAAVAQAFFDRTRAVAAEFIATERDEPEEWHDVASLASADLWLTAEEARTVTAALAAVVDPYRDRARGDAPDGSRRVRIMNVATPYRLTTRQN
jgi:DNA-binding transcriptional ArsR family regulator